MLRAWRAALAISAAFALAILGETAPRAQVRSPYDLGALGLGQALQRLQTTASAMHTGAHPDDEDSALLARLARGDHARVAYLALNRGEGGQNIIGSELFDPLGVIRTEELLQARRIDGAEQLFTRTVDFGFSKTRAEAAAVWSEDVVLDDMVRTIRTYRPLVVISRFSGTPNDGHGHHQLAGYLTPIAVARAADPAAFPSHRAEGLRPWRTRKVYIGEGFRPTTDGGPMLRIETGDIDPLLGRSYFELAMEGRSLHRSQRQGTLELRGPRSSGLRLLSGVAASAPEVTAGTVFAGIDTSIAGIASLAGAPPGTLAAELATAQTAAARALSVYRPLAPQDTLPSIVEGLEAMRRARARVPALGLDEAVRADLDFRLAAKERDFAEAAVRATGVIVDPLADRETVVPGESLSVSIKTFWTSGMPVKVSSARLNSIERWRVEPSAPDGAPVGGRGRPTMETARHEATFRVTLPSDATLTQPYWLTTPRQGALFLWPDGVPKGQPFGPPPMEAVVDLTLGATTINVRRPVEFRVADPIRGELRRRVDVVPALSVSIDTPLAIVPTSIASSRRDIVVQAESLARNPIQGVLHVKVPDGWSISPPDAPFSLARPGERASARFTVTIPPAAPAGRYNVGATASANGIDYASTVTAIAYPHIQTHRLYSAVTTEVQIFDLRTPTVKVGYISGTGDEVASAIRRMGLAVTPLDADMLAGGDLSQFDTIVVGIRAAEVRPDFVANHRRLMRFVENGGALVVQYQPPEYAEQGLPPFPAAVGTRITDETAAVTVLQPGHAAFNTPNRIGPSDWNGWVQERSVNSWATFDARYTPLVEAGDPGEPLQRGGQLVASVGRGVYVYTSYAWFRQLPAGVAGAYRLFANLLALGNAEPRPAASASPGGAQPTLPRQEAVSLSNLPLVRPSSLPNQAKLEADLREAERNVAARSDDPEALIWLGRRQAYLWRYQDAIATFSVGIERWPDNPKFYRHRGHRFVTIRQFVRAQRDFERASALVRGKPDEVEPDGAPNPSGVPRSTLQFNIWYHLGLARYLQGDYRGAHDAYADCMKVSTNDDSIAATSDWMWMTLMRLGRKADADRVLERIAPKMDILENASYHRRLLMYKGLERPQALLDPNADDTTVATQGYGVGNYYKVTGDEAQARRVFERVVSGAGWNAFGFIAAEADLQRR